MNTPSHIPALETVATINPGYDKELLLELMEKYARYVKYQDKTATLNGDFITLVETIMNTLYNEFAVRERGMWRGRNTRIAVFLRKTFDAHSRIWNYFTTNIHETGDAVLNNYEEVRGIITP